MIKKIQCFSCDGTGKDKNNKCIPCCICEGDGVLEEITCEHCGHSYRPKIDALYNNEGICRECYADIETGKYIANFLYVMETALFPIQAKINNLLKEGYLPLGRVVKMNDYWYSQAVIKKNYIQGGKLR